MKDTQLTKTTSTTNQEQSNSLLSEIVKETLKEMSAIKPMMKSFIADQEHSRAYGAQLLAAFEENGINTITQIKFGLKRLRNDPEPYAPSVGQFVQMCYDLPTVEQAYREASTQITDYREDGRRWSHQVVYVAAVATGVFELRTQPINRTKKLFEQNYKDAVKDFMAGDIVDVPRLEPPKKTESKEVSKEFALSELDKIREMFDE